MVRSKSLTQTSHQSPSRVSSQSASKISKKTSSRDTTKTLRSDQTSKTRSSDQTTKSCNSEEVKSPEVLAWELEEEERKMVEEQRKQELIEFLEDLGNSEEFRELLSKRERKREDRDNEKQEQEVIESVDVVEQKKFPFTQLAIRKREMKRRYKNILLKRINKQKMRLQDNNIEKIKQLIAGNQNAFYCHKKERDIERQKKLEEALKVLEKGSTTLNLIKQKINSNVLCYKKIRRYQRKQQKERKIAIIRKLLNEYARQREIDALKNKSYDYKVKRREKLIKDMEIVGVGIEFAREPEEEQEEEKEEVIEVLPEPVLIIKPTKREKKEITKKDKKVKTKKEKPKKAKKEKKTKKEELQKFTLPQIPIVNERYKIIPNEVQDMADLIKELPELEKLDEEKRLYEETLAKQDRPNVSEDTHTVVTPKELIFKGFRNGMLYRRRVTILNSSKYTKKYRLYTIDLKNQSDPNLIQIEHFGIQQLAPGITFSPIIKFSPVKLEEQLIATIVFLTYNSETGEQFQFTLPIICIPLYGKIIITPAEISFETTPIWIAKKRHKHDKYKIFTIKNLGTRTSFVTIKKIHDPLQINEKWDENATECVENVFNYFEFEHYILELQPETQRSLKVYFKNVDHVGFYYEKYCVNIYEKINDDHEKLLGCQELSLTAETSGNFINVTPENLDFGLCVLNSVYQLPVAVKNNDKLPHCLIIKFPKYLSRNLRASATNIIVQPKSKTLVYLKLIPRINIIEEDNPYYNENMNLLRFPVFVSISEKHTQDVPPIKIFLFAIIYPPLPLSLKPIRRSRMSFTESVLFMLTMGNCTTRETICGKISITNESEIVQHYGFFNLPECLVLLPNYGFGSVEPWQTVILSVLFSPTFEDIPQTELIAKKLCYNVCFQISVNTIKNLGGIKEMKDSKSLIQALINMEREIQATHETPLIQEMYLLHFLLVKSQHDIANNSLQESQIQEEEEHNNTAPVSEMSLPTKSRTTSTIRSSTKRSNKSDQTIQYSSQEEKDYYLYFGLPSPKVADENTNCEEELTSDAIISTKNLPLYHEISEHKMQIEAKIINPLCEFSHQFLLFPTTPCGSYSVITIEFRALTNPFNLHCKCGYLKKENPELFAKIDYQADFEIVGIGSQFSVEPSCGTVKSGEIIKITVIARPEIPADIVEDQAKAMKIEESRKILIEQTLKAKSTANKAKVKGKKGKVKKGKKEEGKKNKDKKTKKSSDHEEFSTEIDLPEDLIQLNYLDFFPAEMCVWRSLEPYSIESDFICTVNYRNCDIDYNQDKMFVKATCKVIRPDFIINLKTQHLDFGSVTIGTATTEFIAIQNIKYEAIKPKISLLSPTGPFSCPILKNLTVPPEATLNLPIIFAPTSEDNTTEYTEIRAGKTICPLKISGKGIAPNIFLNPQFLVYRLEAQRDSRTNLVLELINYSDAKAPIKFVKTHELEGEIVKVPKPKPPPKAKTPPPTTSKKEKAKDTKSQKSSKKEKKGKKAKHSMELTEDEEYSLTRFFKTRTEQTLFSMDVPMVTLEPKSETNFKLRFGVPMSPEELEEENKKGKKKSKKQAKKTKTPTEKSETTNEAKKFYVAKYNILIGSNFWRDFIIVASFK